MVDQNDSIRALSTLEATRPIEPSSPALAAVLPDPVGGPGAVPDHADEADHPLRVGGGGGVEPGAAGQGRRGEAATHQPGAGGHHGGAQQRVLSDRLGPAREGDRADRGDHPAHPGRRWRGPHPGPEPVPAVGRRAHQIGFKLRSRSAAGRDEALAAVRRTTGELADLAETAVRDAERLVANAKRALRRARAKAEAERVNGESDPAARRRRGRLAARAVDDLNELLEATRQIAAQTRQRLSGLTADGAPRRVSLHDPDARPIAKGRLGKPVEFGHKDQVADNEDGVVLDYNVEPGNPADAPQLQLGRRADQGANRPTSPDVTADRGHGEKRVDDALQGLGVRNVVVPRKGKPGVARQAEEHPKSLPPRREVAHGDRRQDQHPQTRLRMGPRTPRHHRRCPDLDRPRGPDPQPDQDQRTRQLKTTRADPAEPKPGTPPPTRTRSAALGVLQVEVASWMSDSLI